jgi:prolyl-tRNA synthetase
MRASRMNIVTLREDPADAEIASHRLLLRGGFLHKSGAGLYLYAPLLQRTLAKIATIIKEEIASTGALELTMPILQERALWQRSGRWDQYIASRTMLAVTDRADAVFGLAPTAEEVVTDYAATVVRSYKQLPVTFFQQHTKFRDEIRPRFGLMRVKEFIMMDAYSFHATEESLDQTYQEMRAAYARAFARLGLDSFAVEADSGAIGGSGSHEFMVAAAVGEDTVLICPDGGYAANSERATHRTPVVPAWSAPDEAAIVATPDARTIDEVVAFLRSHGHAEVQAPNLVKTVLMMAKTEHGSHSVAACVGGDRQVNEVKLTNALTRHLSGKGQLLQLRPMTVEEVRETTGADPGFAGPVKGLKCAYVLVDRHLQHAGALVLGANLTGHHLVGVQLARDAGIPFSWEDLAGTVGGDACPHCGKPMLERRGIEVGHVFKLGTKYSKAMSAQFLGQDQALHPFIMGCYGIGTSRVAAAAVEQHHDEHGICWPVSIAPYECVVVPAKAGDAAIEAAADALYRQLLDLGVEAVLDDRDAKPGVKFKDWDLIGIPFRLVCGRGVAAGTVELKPRSGAASEVAIPAAAQQIAELVRSGRGRAQPRAHVG